MKLNEIRDNEGARSNRMRVGRGIGCGKGKTCGRGVKGQKARSGVSINGFEGGQMPIYRRLPKRGFTNIFGKEFAQINLDQLQAAVDAGKIDAKADVTSEAILKAGLVKKSLDGIKILGRGALKSKLTINVESVSASAKAAIEKVGGSVSTKLGNKE